MRCYNTSRILWRACCDLGGSTDNTSKAAPLTFPLSNASYKASSSINPTPDVLIILTPSFALLNELALMIFQFRERGQCREITSLSFNNSSRVTYLTPSFSQFLFT